jgi:hypothetical protein
VHLLPANQIAAKACSKGGVHVRELLALDAIQLPPQGRLVRLGQQRVDLARLVLPPPLGQRPVVSKARGTGGARQAGGLNVVRIEPDAVGDERWATSIQPPLHPSRHGEQIGHIA